MAGHDSIKHHTSVFSGMIGLAQAHAPKWLCFLSHWLLLGSLGFQYLCPEQEKVQTCGRYQPQVDQQQLTYRRQSRPSHLFRHAIL